MHIRYVQRRSKGCVVLIIMLSKEAVLWYYCHYNRQQCYETIALIFFPLSSINNGQTLSDNLFILLHFKVMLHETICNDDFQHDTALQHCCDIVSNGYNIVPALQRYVTLKIVVANRPVYHHLQQQNEFDLINIHFNNKKGFFAQP